jgi:hypothetical protein
MVPYSLLNYPTITLLRTYSMSWKITSVMNSNQAINRSLFNTFGGLLILIRKCSRYIITVCKRLSPKLLHCKEKPLATKWCVLFYILLWLYTHTHTCSCHICHSHVNVCIAYHPILPVHSNICIPQMRVCLMLHVYQTHTNVQESVGKLYRYMYVHALVSIFYNKSHYLYQAC